MIPAPFPIAVKVIDEAQMPAGMDAQIKRVLIECFPHAAEQFARTRAWHGSGPFVTVVAVDSAERVVGHMGLHDRTIMVGERPVRVAGLQNVCIVPSHRKTGLLDRLMTRTMAQATDRGFDGGLLFCLRALGPVYARLGWSELPGRTTTRIDDHGAEVVLPDQELSMFYPLKLATLPPGDIHLRGNDW